MFCEYIFQRLVIGDKEEGEGVESLSVGVEGLMVAGVGGSCPTLTLSTITQDNTAPECI